MLIFFILFTFCRSGCSDFIGSPYYCSQAAPMCGPQIPGRRSCFCVGNCSYYKNFCVNKSITKPQHLQNGLFDILICPYREYTVDISQYISCSLNPSTICILWLTDGRYIRYPIRLENKTHNILCKFSDSKNCEAKRIVRDCCN